MLTQNDFRCPIVPGGHDGAVMFVIESGAAKVNETHICPLDPSVVPFLRN
jgi:hypothetical protein